MYYAYLRISKKKRSKNDNVELSVQEQTERQEMLVKTYCFENGVSNKELEFYRDIVSGRIKNDERQEYSKLKKNLKKGDTVIVTEVSRLGRDIVDTKMEYYWFLQNGVNLIVLELSLLNIDHTKKTESVDMIFMQEQLIAMYTYMAQKTRENISINTSQALQAKKAKGVKLGREATFDHQAVVDYYIENKESTYKEIMEIFGIASLNTVSHIMKKYNVNTRTREIEN